MKRLSIILLLGFSGLETTAQNNQPNTVTPAAGKKMQVVEAACGQCKFGLAGKSCDLAIRVKGQSYFVDGSNINSHGDAHAKNGFCNAISKAEVTGEVVAGRFKATYFKLLSDTSKKPLSN